MDGCQKSVNHSLQKKLNRWIMLISGIFALLAGIISGYGTFVEARDLQDIHLRQVGTLMVSGQFDNDSLQRSTQAMASQEDEGLLVQRLDTLPITLTNDQGISLASYQDGLHTISLNAQDWRALIISDITNPPSLARYAVAQRTEVRDEFAWQGSLSTFLMVLLLAPLLMLVCHLIIKHSFKPIRSLIRILDKRTPMDLTALPEQQLPSEIAPFILSINQLLQRVNQTIKQQQRFVADAAHELRTPLTALSILSENMVRVQSLEEARSRMIPLQEGISRMRTLVTQLLSLAKLQGQLPTTYRESNFLQIIQDVVADLYPLAEAKSIDLGMIQSASLSVQDSQEELQNLVRNAIENAINYSDCEGKIDISLVQQSGWAVFRVLDNGPGIAEHQITKVFEPFYRANDNLQPGNGLGLAISQEIAQRLGGKIKLTNRSPKGLEFCYQQEITGFSGNSNNPS